jgi:hypothetical protein
MTTRPLTALRRSIGLALVLAIRVAFPERPAR